MNKIKSIAFLDPNTNSEMDENLNLSKKFLLFLLSIFLSWKLLRLIYSVELLWNLHNYLIILFSFISVGFSIKYNLYLKRTRTAVLVTFFILLSVLRLAVFPIADPFFLASFVFCLYFLMLTIFLKTSIQSGFKCFEVLLIFLFIYNLFDFIDANSTILNVISYKAPTFMEGMMTPMDQRSQFLFSSTMTDGVVIRSIGVSGTNYASSALTAASAVYFFILGRRVLFSLFFILLLLWGVGSSVFALICVMSLLAIRSKWIVIILPIVLVAIYFLFASRGWDPLHLFQVINNFGATSFMAAIIFGEGSSISSLHSEFRILGLIFSLGLFGVLFLGCMLLNYATFTKYAKLKRNNQFKAGLYFILVLLVSTLHYNTLFVYPNIFFVVMLIALSSVGYIKMRENSSLTSRDIYQSEKSS